MQLTRVLAVAVVCARITRADADTGFVSKIQVYTDSDHTSVVSPVVQAQADVAPDTNVSLGYLADVVTSASVDVVSQASRTTIHDTRHQVSTGVAQIFGSLTARGAYSFSKENDYLSHTLGVGIANEMFDKNTTLSLGYGLALNTVGRADDMNFSRALTVNSISTSWTQIVRPELITQLTYEIANASGYQASPYRFVPVRMAIDQPPQLWVAETDPDTRWRHALVFGANRAIGTSSSIQADYRIYHDTWGITSHTIGARYFVHLSRDFELRLRERFYAQSSANFYQDNYTAPAKYMAFDRELSSLWSETLGVKAIYAFTPHVEGELKVDAFYYYYLDFTPLLSRTGANVGIGVTLTY